jgi:hypothetical protein
MESLPDEAGEARRAWLSEMQGDQTPAQSDFEKSVAWRGVFVAAVIVTVINVPASPPQAPAQPPIRSTV